jgi:hypothetical protein
MLLRMVGAATAAWTLGTASPLAAQTMATTITFSVPVNLTQLSPDLERVRLICMIMPSEVLKYPTGFGNNMEQLPRDEMWVTGGQVVNTMRVVFPIATEWLVNAVGKTANYQCQLMGYSKSLQQWGPFSETSSVPTFFLKGLPNAIGGEFVW